MHTDECTGGWERWLPAISTRKRSFRKVNTDFGYIHRRKESKSDQRAGCQPARSKPWQLKDWNNICQNREKENGNIGVKLGLCLNDVAKLAGNKRREHICWIAKTTKTFILVFGCFWIWAGNLKMSSPPKSIEANYSDSKYKNCEEQNVLIYSWYLRLTLFFSILCLSYTAPFSLFLLLWKWKRSFINYYHDVISLYTVDFPRGI